MHDGDFMMHANLGALVTSESFLSLRITTFLQNRCFSDTGPFYLRYRLPDSQCELQEQAHCIDPVSKQKITFGMDVSRSQNAKQADGLILSLLALLKTIWRFIESDIFTFAVPNTVFGVVSALAYSQLVEGPQPLFLEVLKRLPSIWIFNLYSLLIFDLANQRSPESVQEDHINKPWRPIPSGRITPDQTRKAILVIASASLGLNYLLGVWNEGLLVQVLSYYYNDLKGGDGLSRDAIIAVSYGLANRTSLQLAIGPHNTISQQGDLWIAVISAVILTTMNIQDLKDQEGDSKLGRKTVPLFWGDRACRIALAVSVPSWSCICVAFWQLGMMASIFPCALGALVATRVIRRRGRHQDAQTWRLWCLWHASLYALPLFSGAEQGERIPAIR